MYRYDGPRTRTERLLELGRVHVVAFDVDENRSCTGVGNRQSRGCEGIGHRDDLVARANAGGLESQHQGVGAAGHTDGVLDAERDGELVLEGGQLGTKDVATRTDHAADGLFNLTAEHLDLTVEIEEVDLH
ncbi:MAG: hypothetical protein BWY87_01649 [Deltaproteobacteria bacterium ADurb.Bin510]|nr:MAG: hypothetical protein BWY87_01649 [Deltaproteobacteria bacterium ADurb.Bin510]